MSVEMERLKCCLGIRYPALLWVRMWWAFSGGATGMDLGGMVRGSVGWWLEEAGVGGGVERTGELAGGEDGSGELGAVGDGCWGGGNKW
jgi:hypothetical protein